MSDAPVHVILGASGGIGSELARRLAEVRRVEVGEAVAQLHHLELGHRRRRLDARLARLAQLELEAAPRGNERWRQM